MTRSFQLRDARWSFMIFLHIWSAIIEERTDAPPRRYAVAGDPIPRLTRPPAGPIFRATFGMGVAQAPGSSAGPRVSRTGALCVLVWAKSET